MNRNADNISERELQVRRKLLKAAVYTPPAILGVMTVGIPQAEAATATIGGFTFNVSATSNACNPCQKIINGNFNTNDVRNCLQRQCTNMCVNCDVYVAAAAAYGNTTCRQCQDVLNSGCPAPGACGGCNCRQRRNGQWRCR